MFPSGITAQQSDSNSGPRLRDGGPRLIQNKNNIGAVRLLLASLVIISHAPQQIDGDSRREPLMQVFGGTTLGAMSVAGFFLLSGFLIAMSMARSTSLTSFLTKRILRIWPAYFAAAILCSFAMGPIVGGTPGDAPWTAYLRMVLFLGPIETPGQLTGIPIPVLNGSMWTIPLEFGCYVGVAGLWILGLLARPRTVVVLTFLVGIMSILTSLEPVRSAIDALGHRGASIFVTGPPLSLALFFLTGVTGFLWRNTLKRYATGPNALTAAILLIVSLFSEYTAVIGTAFFGGIALYWICFNAPFGKMRAINDSWDISYGTYLYGWPIATLILYYYRDITPILLALITLLMSWLVGAISWWLIEKWSKDLFSKKRSTTFSQNSATRVNNS